MGPAVFNGGFSTFLAFILVAFSDSYVFTTFFKVISPNFGTINQYKSFNICIFLVLSCGKISLTEDLGTDTPYVGLQNVI